jgi:hypothetical protein
MSTDLDRKIKTALNETRLLLLGIQVLLGFEFQSFFQDGFADLSPSSKTLCVAGLFLVVLSTGALVIPSMEHRLVEAGQSSVRLLKLTSVVTGLGLVPLTVSLGLAVYVVIDRQFGGAAGATIGLLVAVLAGFAWFGLEFLLGSSTGVKPMAQSETPLETKIEQMLVEARVIIPGGQALFGFQFIAMLTTGFDRLPHAAKLLHAAALCLIALNVILLMTPAALHRLSFAGENSQSFLGIGSAFVVTAPLFLAAGIAADISVVLRRTFDDDGAAVAGGGLGFAVLIAFWYAIPLAQRYVRTRRRSVRGNRSIAA